MTRLLVASKNGQVCWELPRSQQCLGDVTAVDRAQFDLAQPEAMSTKLDELGPDAIVNAAAYTAVDKAESEEAPGVIATWAARRGALMLHYSTNYVFDGSGSESWQLGDRTAPLSACGRSTLQGEHALAECGCQHLIPRTSWAYALRSKSSLGSVHRLAGKRDELRIIVDQIGAPTTARLIADATSHVVRGPVDEIETDWFASAVLHVTAAGASSWHEFATAIVEAVRERGVALRCSRVVAISSSDYPTPTERTKNPCLDSTASAERFGVRMRDWRAMLGLCLDEFVA